MTEPTAIDPPSGAASRAPLWYGLGCVVVLLVAGALRYGASLGDCWLDEIWSWFIARDLKNGWEIFTKVHHDNNHYLYTWFLYLLGTKQQWIVYRIPSVVAGIGTVGVAGLIGKRGGRLASFTAMLLTGGSYLFVYYASEARGYGLVVCFALLSFFLLDRSLSEARPLNDFAFALVAILGFLSHLQFVFCYTGCIAWSLWRLNTDAGSGRRLLWANLRCHLPPISFVCWLYYVDISKLRTGGANIQSLDRVLVELLSMTIGGPAAGWPAAVVAVLVAAATVAGVLLLARRGSGEWVFYLTTMVAAPIVFSVVMQQKYLLPRHYLVCVIFALLCVNRSLIRLAGWGTTGRVVLVLLLAAILASNAWQTRRLLEVGRGQYRKALLAINERTQAPRITIGSDNLLRNGMLFEYYQLQVPELKPIDHFVMHPRPGERKIVWPGEGTEWVIRHVFDPNRPPPSITDGFGIRYRLVEEYPYAGPSGWMWAVYRKQR
jgi:hypothetical protein